MPHLYTRTPRNMYTTIVPFISSSFLHFVSSFLADAPRFRIALLATWHPISLLPYSGKLVGFARACIRDLNLVFTPHPLVFVLSSPFSLPLCFIYFLPSNICLGVRGPSSLPIFSGRLSEVSPGPLVRSPSGMSLPFQPHRVCFSYILHYA